MFEFLFFWVSMHNDVFPFGWEGRVLSQVLSVRLLCKYVVHLEDENKRRGDFILEDKILGNAILE